MEKVITLPKIGTRVKGIDEYSKINNYTGTVRKINKGITQIGIERDDKREGGGVRYKGRNLWISSSNSRKKCFGSSMGSGFLYILSIDNWMKRIK